MKTPDHSTDGTIAENRAEKGIRADRYWQTAGDRVLLYLRCLNFPAPQALELALGALKAAEQNTSPGSGNSPVAEAMGALHQIMGEQKPAMAGQNSSPAAWCDVLPPSTPPLHRLPMVPEEVAPAHWRSLLARLFGRSRTRPRQG
jgi:hypothetical protein